MIGRTLLFSATRVAPICITAVVFDSCESSKPSAAARSGDAASGASMAVPDGGTSGGACVLNADCADSGAAEAMKNIRCVGFEIYCLKGECYGDCADTCTAIRTDIDPCPAPRLCAPATGVCRIAPIKCQSAGDCPKYLPPTVDGGTAAWTCEAGTCTYPGYNYTTM